MRAMRVHAHGRGAAVLLMCATMAATAGAVNPSRGLPDYRHEVRLLADVPGASSSVAAGLFNPGLWAVNPHGGFFFGWSDSVASRDASARADELATVLSARWFGFGWRRFQFRDDLGEKAHLDEYTFGLSGGDRDHAFGISYSWNRGDDRARPRHQRLMVGDVSRWRFLSVGLAGAFDLERKDNWGVLDIGLRPFGPRWTFFADAVTNYGERFEDITLGGGLEARPVPGLTLGVKLDDLGDVTNVNYRIALNLGPGQGRPEARLHFSDGDHVGTTWCLELGGKYAGLDRALFHQGRRYPEISLKGPMQYRRYRWFDDSRTLMGTLTQLSAYAEDPRVGGVVLNLSGMRIGGELLWELREQLAGLRATGKTVTVYADRLTMSGYMLASVADRIWMDPQGEIDMPGVTVGRTYIRGLFDKLGIGIAELRFFTYKSALESFSRTSMSEADREQLGAIADGIYETVAETVTHARGLSPAEWDRLVDEQGMLTAQDALAAGLVDSLGTYDRARKDARRVKPRATPDISTQMLAGVMGDPVWGPLEWGEPDRIAILYAIGECSMDSGIKGRLLSKKIKAAREDGKVKAVVLRADSPGGDALPSDLVSRELLETAKRKPVIVSQGQVAGSGGYWISMFGDSILASPFTITGSIGVIGGYYWNAGIGEKIGFTYDLVKRGEHADLTRGMLLPFINQTIPERPMTDEERALAETWIRGLYDDFVAKVAEGRGMTPDEVDAVGQGRVWLGTDGQRIGLVDELGGLWESLRMAKDAAGIPGDREVAYTEGPDVGLFPLEALRPRLIGLWQRTAGRSDGEAPAVDGRGWDDNPWTAPLEDALIRRILGDDRFSQLSPAERFYWERILQSRGRPVVVMDPIDINFGGRP